MAKKVSRKENGFDTLARLIKEEGEDIRGEMHAMENRLSGRMDAFEGRMGTLERKMDEGFTSINRKLDTIIQSQLDEHANRIKKLEEAVFSR